MNRLRAQIFASTPAAFGLARRVCLLLLALALLAGCERQPAEVNSTEPAPDVQATDPAQQGNTELVAIVAAFLAGEQAGWRAPGQAGDKSAAAWLSEIEQRRALLLRLDALREAGLGRQQDIDRRLLSGILRADINTAQTRRRWANDPTLYLPTRALDALLDPLWPGDDQQRLAELGDLLGSLDGQLQQARDNLERPPRFFTDSAIFQLSNSLQSLRDALQQLPPPTAEVAARLAAGEQALEAFLAFLNNDLLPRSDGDWALGREAWEYVLRHRWHMPDSSDDILQRGLDAFAQTEALAQQVAGRMQPGLHWTEVYEQLKDDHPPADGIKAAYQAQMDAAQVFVREHAILTLPEGERVITIDTPPAMRRSSPFGTFQSASPYDGGLEGRLILTPIETWMSAEQQAQRLRSHHTAWIPVIAVHEAYPGHHAQALVVNQNPNLLRRVIRESIFSEGWGLFTEELMFEQGFLVGDDVRLTQLRNRLWRAARVILDVSLHTGAMSFDEAVAFLVEKVRFEPYAAELEVGMYVRNPTYVLGYLIGMQEIEAIRAEWIARYGEPEPPSEFYDRLLYIGAIPPALLREELFAD
jgi:uncharacterized protein (DUF885 family)